MRSRTVLCILWIKELGLMIDITLKRVVVTGAAGFIGSNLVDSLLKQGIEVLGIDNLSTGRIEFLSDALSNSKFRLLKQDLFLDGILSDEFIGFDAVFHMAANADVRFGIDNPSRDLEQNTIVTHRVLEATRVAGIKNFVFSSTGSVYGEARVIPTPEDAPFPIQTSLYGASKLACEGLIAAYAESFGMKTWIFRFVSILGPRYTHGHVYDFYQQLVQNPSKLIVLGNGYQKKSYLHVSDCIEAIHTSLREFSNPVNIINLGVDSYCEVRDSISWIINEMKLDPEIIFGEESKGWIGDNPIIYLDTQKIQSLGWTPRYSIEEAVRNTVSFMQENPWIFNGSVRA
jgi:UDP-glucose 4-epimerase